MGLSVLALFASCAERDFDLDPSNGSKEQGTLVLNLNASAEFDQTRALNENDYKKAIIVLGAILTSDINGEKSEYDMFSNVRELRMIPGGDIFLTIILPTGNEFQVKLKNIENINEKMLWLRYAISKGTFDDLPNGTFDMTGDEYIYREYR